MSKKNLHVVPRVDGWAVRRAGNSRDTSHHSTQQAAIKAATDAAKRSSSEVITHGRDGKIRSKDSHGNDPAPPKDTEH